MAKHSERSLLPYTPEQLFELVADVERYSEFMPCWAAASVRNRQDDVLHVEQHIRLGVMEERFRSRAVLRRPASVQISSNDGPFQHLLIHWQIQPMPPGAQMTLTLDFQFRSFVLDKLVGSRLLKETGRLLQVFERRAHHLYGGHRGGWQ